jgi:hypothetical protein
VLSWMKSSYLGRWFTSFASVDCWSVSPGHRKPKLSTCGARGWTATEVDEESTDDSDLNSESKWTDEPRDRPCARPMVSAVHRKRCPAKVSASRAWEREVGGLVSQTVGGSGQNQRSFRKEGDALAFTDGGTKLTHTLNEKQLPLQRKRVDNRTWRLQYW